MPLFAKHEPDLAELAAYILEIARGRGYVVNRARLVKLLYLVDVERIRSRREPLTGIGWVFQHMGPSAPELDRTLRQMETVEKDSATWGRSIHHDSTRGDDWVTGTKMLVDGIIRAYAGLDFNVLLDYVYFQTGPMIDAVRDQPLQMDRARDDRRPRRARPLETSAAPHDVAERLERWRTRNRERFPALQLDPPARFLDGVERDFIGDGVRGRLHIPEATEL